MAKQFKGRQHVFRANVRPQLNLWLVVWLVGWLVGWFFYYHSLFNKGVTGFSAR